MKTIKTIRKVEDTRYACDICKKDYMWSSGALQCEKSHECVHVSHYEFKEANDKCSWLHVRGIINTCKLCGKELEEALFDDISYDQEKLKAIFDILYSRT